MVELKERLNVKGECSNVRRCKEGGPASSSHSQCKSDVNVH